MTNFNHHLLSRCSTGESEGNCASQWNHFSFERHVCTPKVYQVGQGNCLTNLFRQLNKIKGTSEKLFSKAILCGFLLKRTIFVRHKKAQCCAVPRTFFVRRRSLCEAEKSWQSGCADLCQYSVVADLTILRFGDGDFVSPAGSRRIGSFPAQLAGILLLKGNIIQRVLLRCTIEVFARSVRRMRSF
ncbi:hypothetical protein [Undibacterium squillarum]|uniref:hypothetical protein n=1 Tax=Undibacterium squillarum TaxID=1131567 RepID=UPI0016773302|nr:hypothetical protein [Undibacterium squillarum]